MQAVTITQISPSELDERIQGAVDRAFSKRDNSSKISENIPEEYISLDEATKRLGVDKSTLHNWRKRGVIKGYQLGYRVYLKWSEVEAAMVPLK